MNSDDRKSHILRGFHILRARWGRGPRRPVRRRLGDWRKRKRKRKRHSYEYDVLIFHYLFSFHYFGLPTFLGRRSLAEVGGPFTRVLSEIRAEVTRKLGKTAYGTDLIFQQKERKAAKIGCGANAYFFGRHLLRAD